VPSRLVLTIIALAGALLGATVAAPAQTYPLPTAPPGANAPGAQAPGAPRRGNRVRTMLRDLNLSSDQRGQIRAMFQQFRAARNTATPITRRALLAQIEGVLTPQQRSRFEARLQRARIRR
jgi:Spy/CpxP family protein refolding chaperone